MAKQAEVTTMSVSIRVLVVDGSRRMSWGFFKQIPLAELVDEDGIPMPDTLQIWGWVDWDNTPFLVGVKQDDRLYMQRIEWFPEKITEEAEQMLRAKYDQLYVGG